MREKRGGFSSEEDIINDIIKKYKYNRRKSKIARKLRNWFPGATYHLMERGIRRLAIFQDEMDLEMFLEILKKSETAEQERL